MARPTAEDNAARYAKYHNRSSGGGSSSSRSGGDGFSFKNLDDSIEDYFTDPLRELGDGMRALSRTTDYSAEAFGSVEGWDYSRMRSYNKRRGDGYREGTRGNTEEARYLKSQAELEAARSGYYPDDGRSVSRDRVGVVSRGDSVPNYTPSAPVAEAGNNLPDPRQLLTIISRPTTPDDQNFQKAAGLYVSLGRYYDPQELVQLMNQYPLNDALKQQLTTGIYQQAQTRGQTIPGEPTNIVPDSYRRSMKTSEVVTGERYADAGNYANDASLSGAAREIAASSNPVAITSSEQVVHLSSLLEHAGLSSDKRGISDGRVNNELDAPIANRVTRESIATAERALGLEVDGKWDARLEQLLSDPAMREQVKASIATTHANGFPVSNTQDVAMPTGGKPGDAASRG